jgi:hypothetical protein
MPAFIVSLSSENGVERFYCPFCAATVFDAEDGIAEEFCSHVRVFVDWVQEANLPSGAPAELADHLDDIDPSDPSELSTLFGEDTVIFELTEASRGGGHDGSSCLVAIGVAVSGVAAVQ